MEAMTELIWTGSYGSTTIDQICDKAGVKLLLPRLDHGQRLDARMLVASQVDQLDGTGEAGAAACSLGLRYVYAGASRSGFWEPHQFPPRDRLRAAASLEEVFTHGDASVFRTRLDCSDSPEQRPG